LQFNFRVKQLKGLKGLEIPTFKMSAFPTISFQPFINGTESQKLGVEQQIYDAFHNYGWVYLKDFGIPEQKIDEMFRQVSVASLFRHL
jgi:isopenicillin N synthase-like dioxygenase